jgi:Carboxypeptidase regulatory-like domain
LAESYRLVTARALKGKSQSMSLRRRVRGSVLRTGGWIALSVCLYAFGFGNIGVAQPQPPTLSQGDGDLQSQSGAAPSDAATHNNTQAKGRISGSVTVRGGGVAVGAQVRLTRDGQPPIEVVTNDDGEYSFADQPSGPFELKVTAAGFQTASYSGNLGTDSAVFVPALEIDLERATTEVKVTETAEEVATEQVKYQEQQRVLGIIPNFYASYVPDAAPLPSKLKFQLAWKSVSDPITIFGAAFLAGIYQASDEYGGYGQGAQGYAKRFGATYGDVFIGTFIDSAVLPSVFHQDPRYFYRGTGSKKSRLVYALANSVMCKGDNKKYEPNYSAILGSFITSGISYSYYPASDRSAELLIQTALIRIAEGSVAGLFQEFVVRRLTPHLKKDPPQP